MCLSKSSIGRKAITAVTGLILFGFVVGHMLGNLQIFLGQDALNDYAKHLKELFFLLWPARIFLLITLVIHVAVSLKLAFENKKARPIPYAVKGTVQASLASLTMVVTGMVILFFVIYHLLHFTFRVTDPGIAHLFDSKGREDVYSMVILGFQNYLVSGGYLLAMFFLCAHLSHGFASFPQSLGLNNEKLMPVFKTLAWVLATLTFLGNSSIPAAVLLGILKLPSGGA